MSNVRRELPQWCKDAKKAMIDRGITGPKELADTLGLSRGHVSAVINGRLISDDTRDRVCSYLDVTLTP